MTEEEKALLERHARAIEAAKERNKQAQKVTGDKGKSPTIQEIIESHKAITQQKGK